MYCVESGHGGEVGDPFDVSRRQAFRVVEPGPHDLSAADDENEALGLVGCGEGEAAQPCV